MNRRTLLTGIAAGVTVTAGCLSGDSTDDTGAATGTDSVSDAPEFEADEDAPGEFVLLRNQPQEPNGISVGDEFETGVVLGNAGGESVSGDVGVGLLPPSEDETAQGATIEVEGENEIPSGAARFFTAGPFTPTVAGDWELVAGPEIERVHRTYDPVITVEERPGD